MDQLYLASSTAGFAPHVLLRELGVPFELKFLDLEAREHKQPAYLALNPLGRIPALLADGQPIAESGAICLWLADRHPQTGLAPSPEDVLRAPYLQWMFFLSNTVHATLMQYFYPQRYIEDPAQHDAAKRAGMAAAGDWFAEIERHLSGNGPYLLGDRISAADFYLFMLVRWGRHFDNPPASLPALGAFMQRLFERPAVKDAFAAEGTTERFF